MPIRLRIRCCAVQLVAIATAIVISSGCVPMTAMRCADASDAVSETLYFGTATPDGVVNQEQWQRFLDESVTPRFPNGLSTWTADGRWRGADGQLVREGAHVLQIIRFDPAQAAAIELLIAEFKRRFQQESVLRVQTAACASL